MKTTPACLKRLSHMLLVVLTACLTLSSCDDVIFDYEGDCDTRYHLRFRYDRNMKFADAFANEVTSVRLMAFDSDGRLVWQTEESGERLASEGYDILLPLGPGDYTLTAWCGLGNGESFTVGEMPQGSAHSDAHCRLNRTAGPDGGAVSDKDLNRLFHGTLRVSLPVEEDGGDIYYTMPLTKDTNVFRVVLQHLSGQDISADDFTFAIEDNNGWLAHDNSLRDDEKITYRAWSTYDASSGVDVPRSGGDWLARQVEAPAGRAITQVSVAVAELTVSRLVERDWTVNSKPVLVIRRADDGDLVARIPIIDFALMVKGNYNRDMSNQEYLDRQDEYNMTFFLDDDRHWLATSIIINSWRVVLNDVDF